MTDQDTEWAFVRILSVRGTKLFGGMSAEDQRDRIRVAILAQGRRDDTFDFGAGRETFQQGYERCYHRPLDLRRYPRKEDGTPASMTLTAEELDDSHDDDDEDDEELIE